MSLAASSGHETQMANKAFGVKVRARTYGYLVPRRIWGYRLQSYEIVFNYARKWAEK